MFLRHIGQVWLHEILVNSARKRVETRRHWRERRRQSAHNEKARQAGNTSRNIHHVVGENLVVFSHIAVVHRIAFRECVFGKYQHSIVYSEHFDDNVSHAKNPTSFLCVFELGNGNKSLNTFWRYSHVGDPHGCQTHRDHPESASNKRIRIEAENISIMCS